MLRKTLTVAVVGFESEIGPQSVVLVVLVGTGRLFEQRTVTLIASSRDQSGFVFAVSVESESVRPPESADCRYFGVMA